MKLVRPRPGAVKQFDPFWGCATFWTDDCKGTREILEDGTPDMFEEDGG